MMKAKLFKKGLSLLAAFLLFIQLAAVPIGKEPPLPDAPSPQDRPPISVYSNDPNEKHRA